VPDEACGGYHWRKPVGLHRRTSLPNQLTARPPNREIKVRGLRSSRWCTRGGRMWRLISPTRCAKVIRKADGIRLCNDCGGF